MTNDKLSLGPGELKINCHDPRHHQEFLLLSNSVNAWKGHLNDRSWWLAQENQCLEIFQRHGYDLQSGVWFCLISCQRHGWAGIANATMLLADGFGKKQHQCWPPAAATDLRQQIIEWYCTHASTGVYGLPLTSAKADTISQLEDAISILIEHAFSLKSTNRAGLNNLLDYLRMSRKSLKKKILQVQPSLLEPTLARYISPNETVSLRLRSPKAPWKALLSGGVAGIFLTLCALGINYWISLPSTVIKLNQLWPGNFYSARWQKNLLEKADALPMANSWSLLNLQLNALDQRLLDAEQKRKPYMTISELKTAIYNMRQTLQQGGEPVIAQLDDLQRKVENNQPISSTDIRAISEHLEALNSRLILLTAEK